MINMCSDAVLEPACILVFHISGIICSTVTFEISMEAEH